MTLAGRLLQPERHADVLFGLGLTAKNLGIAPGGLRGISAQFLQPLGCAGYPCTVLCQPCVSAAPRLAGQTLMVAASTLGTVLSAALGGVLIDALGVRAMLLFAAAISAAGTLGLFFFARGRAEPLEG